MFQGMEKLLVPNSLRLLLCDASISININNQATKPLDDAVRFNCFNDGPL